jgi:hypothetical protein
MATRKYNKNRKTTKKSNKRSSKKRVRKIVGGKLFGKGTFGTVYGEPRMLCVNETSQTPNIHNEVSKIYRDDEDADEEMEVIVRLSKKMSEDELTELKKYSVLPKKQCNLNINTLKRHPYKTVDWRRGSRGETGAEEIFSNDESRRMEYNKLVIFDKGGDDLGIIFSKINSEQMFKDCLTKIISLGKGIQILQNAGFIHGDIKELNTIEENGTFKLIDMADVREISTTNDSKAMPTAFGYYTWPSISSYAFFFDKKTPRTPADIKMTQIILGKLYEEQRYYNESMYKNGYLKRYLIAPFKIRTTNGFNAEQIERTYRLLIELYLQKTCGATKEGINTHESYEQFVEKLSNPAIADNGVPAFLDKYNRIFQSFGTVGEAKNDLFKRMDIYSFGMIILNCVGSYLNYKQTSVIDEEHQELMMKLYAFVYKCCDQTERVADINQLIVEYEGILNPVETVAPVVVQLPEPEPEPAPPAPPAQPLHRYLLRSMGLVRESS